MPFLALFIANTRKTTQLCTINTGVLVYVMSMPAPHTALPLNPHKPQTIFDININSLSNSEMTDILTGVANEDLHYCAC